MTPISENILQAKFVEVESEKKSLLEFSLRKSFGAKRIGVQEKAEFCLQLAVMLQSRISLRRALEISLEQSQSERMKKVIEKLVAEVRKGNSFARALQMQPDVFDNLFVVNAEVGEETGHLPQVFTNLAQYLEKIGALRKKMLQSMAYPLLVLSVAFGAVMFLLTYIVPTFADMFKSFQVELPLSTRIVLKLSNLVTTYGVHVTVALLALVFILRSAIVGSSIRSKIEAHLFNIPYFGTILLKNQVARFCRTLGTLLKAQISLVDALDVTFRIFSNEEVKEEIKHISLSVRQGRTIADPLVRSKIFPPMVGQMIAVGEETSELDAMLLKVAEYYEREIDSSIETLSSIIEPVIIVLLGLLVGTILVSMYMPMFDLVNVVGGQEDVPKLVEDGKRG